MAAPILTASTREKTLYDKYLAFLGANNPTGYLDDPEVPIDDTTIGGVLVGLSREPQVRLKDLKFKAKLVVRLSERVIVHSKALNLCSMAMGYADYHELSQHYTNGYSLVENQRTLPDNANRRIFTQD